jgi:hypothetical protein
LAGRQKVREISAELLCAKDNVNCHIFRSVRIFRVGAENATGAVTLPLHGPDARRWDLEAFHAPAFWITNLSISNL